MELQGVPASLTHEQLDQLCDLLAAKLAERSDRVPASQAGCRGFESRRPLHSSQRGWLRSALDADSLLKRCALCARAARYSPKIGRRIPRVSRHRHRRLTMLAVD